MSIETITGLKELRHYKMFWSIWILYIFINFPNEAVGMDCHTSYIVRYNRNNVTETCDQGCGWAQCGDVCIDAGNGEWCYCGMLPMEKISLYHGENNFCCVESDKDKHYRQCLDDFGYGNCPQGKTTSKTDTCNNHCFNDYETSLVVGLRSNYRCGDHHCVQAHLMCQGYPLCPDSRDAAECHEGLKCIQGRGITHKIGSLVSDLSGGHKYCNYDSTHNDGEYDTITREDEFDLDILSNKVYVNYTSIQKCNSRVPLIYGKNHYRPGLMCGAMCLRYSDWCRKDKSPISCSKYNFNFTTENKQLCGNTTFWKGKTCDLFSVGGRKIAFGKRCTGSAQHCSYPWYTSSIYHYEVRQVVLLKSQARKT